jgi:ribonuclease P protein component
VPTGRFGRRHRLRTRRDLQKTLRKGRRSRGTHLAVAVINGAHDWPRLGLAVSKAAGNSPQRTRLKRLLREAFRAARGDWPAIDLVAMCRVPWPNATCDDVLAELNLLVARTQQQTAAKQPPRTKQSRRRKQ